jgi:Protein of unknown function (DUF2911)
MERFQKGHFMMPRKSIAVAIVLTTFALAALTMTWAQQPPQDKSKRPSPPGTAECTVKGKKVAINYGRPSMKGRKIMGELVPYGQVWRTGANEATTLTTAADLNIGGTKVPAGTYTLYTLPSADTWKLIINKQTGQWGTEYNQDQDLARVDMKKADIAAPVEQFTIALDQDGNDSCTLALEWEKTRASVAVKAE